MSTSQPRHPGLPFIRVELPASLTAPRQARGAVRDALTAWGLTALTSDAELLTSEIVANAAEYGRGPIGLTIRQHTGPAGQRGICCQITDTSPARPQPLAAGADSERGRGLRIVQAIATTSGITGHPHGKTAWFTLTDTRQPDHSIRQADFEAEPGA